MTSPVLDGRRPSTLAHPAKRVMDMCPSGKGKYGRIDRILFGILDFTHERQHARAEVFDLFLEVQEPSQDQVDAAFAIRRNAFRDLLRCADQLRAEAVVVLNQVLE